MTIDGMHIAQLSSQQQQNQGVFHGRSIRDNVLFFVEASLVSVHQDFRLHSWLNLKRVVQFWCMMMKKRPAWCGAAAWESMAGIRSGGTYQI